MFYLCIIFNKVWNERVFKGLIEIHKKYFAAGPRLGRAAGPRGPQLFSNLFSGHLAELNTGYIAGTPQTQSAFSNQQMNISNGETLIIVNEQILRMFREYVFSRFTRDDARKRFNYFRRFWRIVLNPPEIAKLTYKQAQHFLNGLAAFRDFCRLYGIPFNVNISELRKLAPRNRHVKVLEYEEDSTIIEKALNELRKLPKQGTWKVLGLIAFFTGLRSTEIIYMVKNWEKLRKISLDNNVVIIELGYERKSKKAWITMMPKKLARRIDMMERNKVGINAFRDMLYKRGFNVSIMRKSHLAILSAKMMQHEIDLLQGRVSSITVRHYTKHLREIAAKYIECFKQYLHLLAPKCEESTK